jgi:hypothetical protein
MGRVIAATAAIEDVAHDVKETLESARATGGEVAELAEHRLAERVEQIAAARAAFVAAEAAETIGERTLHNADFHADQVIGGVRDAMWNAVERVQSHPAMSYVFPDGVRTYTRSAADAQPLIMQILESRLETVAAPLGWTKERRAAWAPELAAARAPLEPALEAFKPLEASRTVAEASYRATVRAGRAQLAKYKRDLVNLGLTETQIHAVIPDAGGHHASRSKAAKKKASEPTD